MAILMAYLKYWEVLDIEPTTDKGEIKKAYAKQAKKFHPEDHPEQFKQLQAAYKSALAYAKNQPSLNTQRQFQKELSSFHQNEQVESNISKQPNTTTSDTDATVKAVKSGIDNVSVNVSFGRQENKVISDLNDTRVTQAEKKKKIVIESTDVHNKTKRESEKQYLLNKIEKILNLNCDLYTLDTFFSNERVLAFLSDYSFKVEVEKLIIKKIKDMKSSAINYLENISEFLGLSIVKETVEKYKKKQRIRLIGSVALFIIVVIGISSIGTIQNRAQKQAEEEKQQEIRDVINKESQKNTQEMINEQKQERDDEVSDTIREMYKQYLHGVQIVNEGDGYRIYDEQQQLISTTTYTSINYTTSSYLVLIDNEMVYVLNCETKEMLSDVYRASNSIKVTTESGPYQCVVLTTQDERRILLDPNGNLITIDASFGYNDTSKLIHLENGAITSIE